MTRAKQSMRIAARMLAAQPILGQRGKAIQPFGTLVHYQLALADGARAESVKLLNQILSDTLVLRDLYKKSHWQVSGPTFFQLHLLFEQHFCAQSALIDMLGERVQTLGGVAIVMARDVVKTAKVQPAPADREQVPVQLTRLLDAHEVILRKAREAIEITAKNGDHGTNDMLMSDVVRANEKQVWFLSEHLVDTPLVRAQPGGSKRIARRGKRG